MTAWKVVLPVVALWFRTCYDSLGHTLPLGPPGLAETVRAGLIRLDGPRSLVRAFPTWFTLSAFAGVERVGASVAARPA